jgi:uncharacterized membrane protein
MVLVRDLDGSFAPEASVSRTNELRRTWGWLADPVAVFIALSALFGAGALIVNPPLRGPDETAHFLRVYGITEGDIVPSIRDGEGRKGGFVPAHLHDDLILFEDARQKNGNPGFSYRSVVRNYLHQRATRVADADARPSVFVRYNGAESYSPAPYLPYIAATAIGRFLHFDFLSLFYLMRIAGFVAMTAAAAYAIWIVPNFKWTFLLIAMLPSALYGRTVVGADGASLSFNLIVTAFCVRAACRLGNERIWERATFTTLCALSKLPQIAWLILEAMRRPLRQLPRRWATLALVTLPGFALTALWLATGADVGAYRMAEGAKLPAELFEPASKISFLLADPLHFFDLLFATLNTGALNDLWRQLIGVLGWLDTPLMDWVYPVLSALLVASFLVPLRLERGPRYRIAAVSALAVVAYVLAVYLIFYLTWTPIDAPDIWGVQGRYFVVVLAPLSVACAAIIKWGAGETTRSCIAICGATLSGVATFEAIARVNW